MGTPSGANYKDVRTWGPMVAKVEWRLAKWKRKLLSKGRIEPTILLHIPINSSRASLRRLNPSSTDFLRGDLEEIKRYQLVAWERIQLSLTYGGLGIRSVLEMNLVLQGNEYGDSWRKEKSYGEGSLKQNLPWWMGRYYGVMSRPHGKGL